MRTILSLFGKSPFAPLASHMESVNHCVLLIPELFQAIEMKNKTKQEEIIEKIQDFEHQADLTKNNIRDQLTKGLFLAISREDLLEILSMQDTLADIAEDIALLTSYKEISIIDNFKETFYQFLNKNLEAFEGARKIIKELHELLESSFGGVEAEKVKKMVEEVAHKEHQADVIQRELLKKLYESEAQLNYSSFYLWQRIFEKIAALSNISENLGYRVRRTLETK